VLSKQKQNNTKREWLKTQRRRISKASAQGEQAKDKDKEKGIKHQNNTGAIKTTKSI